MIVTDPIEIRVTVVHDWLWWVQFGMNLALVVAVMFLIAKLYWTGRRERTTR